MGYPVMLRPSAPQKDSTRKNRSLLHPPAWLNILLDHSPRDAARRIRQLIGHMWMRYTVALLLLAALALSSYLILIRLNRVNETSGERISLAARQLTMAERSGRLASQLLSVNDERQREEVRNDLKRALFTLQYAHEQLKSGHLEGQKPSDSPLARLGLELLQRIDPQGHAQTALVSPEVERIFSQHPHRLDAKISGYTKKLQILIDTPDRALQGRRQHIDSILAFSAEKLTPSMQALLDQYRKESVARVDHVIVAESLVFAATLGVLLLEALLIFRPVIGRVRRTAQILMQETQFNEHIVAITQTFVVGLDRSGAIVLFNRYSEDMSGWGAFDVEGTNFAERFLPAEERTAFVTLVRELYAGRQPGGYKTRLCTRNDKTLLIDWRFATIHDPHTHEPVMLLATGVDVTALTNSAERLRSALEETQNLAGRLRDEVEHAARLQRSLLPAPEIRLPGILGSASLTTSSEVGGDYYDYYAVDNRYAIILVGDASGHGVAAGTLVTAAKIAVQGVMAARMIDPSQILESINGVLSANTPDNMFMTMACASLDSVTGQMRIASAGHVFPYLYKRWQGRWLTLETCGRPLGRNATDTFATVNLNLEVGDRLFLYSDGLVEELSPEGEEFGFEQLEKELEDCRNHTLEETRQRLYQALQRHRREEQFSDDVTLLIFEHTFRNAFPDQAALAA